MSTERFAMYLGVALILLALAGCGPAHVTVPDTRPPIQPPPADAMQPCPTGKGPGIFPAAKDGSRAAILRAVHEAAGMWRTCIERHQTLREAIHAYEKEQRD